MHLSLRMKVYIAVVLAFGSWYVLRIFINYSTLLGGMLIFLSWFNSASIATLVRFTYIGDYRDPRNLFYNHGLIIWSELEVGFALIASSAAKLRPLLIQLKLCVRRYKSQHSSQEACDQSLQLEVSPYNPRIDSVTETQCRLPLGSRTGTSSAVEGHDDLV
jgi:hypothetical protein